MRCFTASRSAKIGFDRQPNVGRSSGEHRAIVGCMWPKISVVTAPASHINWSGSSLTSQPIQKEPLLLHLVEGGTTRPLHSHRKYARFSPYNSATEIEQRLNDCVKISKQKNAARWPFHPKRCGTTTKPRDKCASATQESCYLKYSAN